MFLGFSGTAGAVPEVVLGALPPQEASAPCFAKSIGRVFTIRWPSVLKRRKTAGTPYYGVVRNTRVVRLSVVAQPYSTVIERAGSGHLAIKIKPYQNDPQLSLQYCISD
jgi:hypothetical protein